ncbi:MAG: DUF411 domain-containing protein [Hyphomicrobiaceae bacterium]
MMNRDPIDRGRRLMLGQFALGGLMLLGGAAWAAEQPSITVWKDPNCGCCGGWVEHLRHNGFAVTMIETGDVQAIKAERGVPAELASCHTAEIAGFTIEGHVPAQAIARLVTEKPAARGLAVPGMPVGSPGMEGGRPEPYDVVLFADGTTSRYARFIGATPL